MPSSRPNHIPTVIGIAMTLNPRSILDVGVGFGKWGFLLREYTDIRLSENDPARYQRENWKVRIDGIEGYQPYVTPVHRYIYNDVTIGDARDLIERVGRYDMILIADVIEHFSKTDGVHLLQRCVEHCDGAVIVTTPGSFVEQGAACGNELERHRSEWCREDFESFPGAKARIVENDILVAVLPAHGVTAPEIAPPRRSSSQSAPPAASSRTQQPLLQRALRKARRLLSNRPTIPPAPPVKPEPKPGFTTSPNYWEARYATGGTSGVGSYGQLAVYKAEFINRVLREHQIKSVIDYGVGDGSQLGLLAQVESYVGVDVSPTVIAALKKKHRDDPHRRFELLEAGHPAPTHWRADMVLSLDVIYHLVEDEIYESYLRNLFAMASRYVIVYSSDRPRTGNESKHVRHRPFTESVRNLFADWSLVRHEPNPYAEVSHSEFFVFDRG